MMIIHNESLILISIIGSVWLQLFWLISNIAHPTCHANGSVYCSRLKQYIFTEIASFICFNFFEHILFFHLLFIFLLLFGFFFNLFIWVFTLFQIILCKIGLYFFMNFLIMTFFLFFIVKHIIFLFLHLFLVL